MKKFLLVLFNLILVVATGGLWLLPLLIFILVRRSNKNKPNNLPTSVAVSADKSSPSGAARESLFNDATKLAGAAGTKGTVDVAVADQLLAKIDEIANIFAETKKA